MKKLFLMLTGLFLLIWMCDSPTESNKPPSCKITTPDANTEINEGGSVEIKVEAKDDDGEIDEVRFYIDGNGKHSDTEFPYTYIWEFEPGFHIIKAVAIDDKGIETSDSINVDVCLPSKYNGVPSNYYEDYFIEDFENNENGWPVGEEDSLTVEISSNNYTIDNRSNTRAFFPYVDNLSGINSDVNFEIETRLSVSYKNINKELLGLFYWGYDPENNKDYEIALWYPYDYGFYNVFGIYDWDGNTLTALSDESYSYLMNDLGSYNKLTIRKYDDYYYFFLNENYLYKYPYSDFYGNYSGFGAYANTKLIIDYFKIHKINNPDNNFTKPVEKESTVKSKYMLINDKKYRMKK